MFRNINTQLYFCITRYRVYNKQITLYGTLKILSSLDSQTYDNNTEFLAYIFKKNNDIM